MEFFVKHWGDLASIVGLAYAIYLAYKAKTAAEQARDAAQQAKERISNLDTIGDLSTAISLLNEILRLQRTRAWSIVREIVLDRYTSARAHLARCEQAAGVMENHRGWLRDAMIQLGIIVEEIEGTGMLGADALGSARYNRILSDQIDTLERARIDVKKAGA